MKREVEYHEVTVTFVVTMREARRATGQKKSSDVRSALAGLIRSGLTANATNCLDAEDMTVMVDGQPQLG